MTDDLEQDELGALAAEYALGLLTEVEAEAFEDAINSDPELREIYVSWAEEFATLTDGIPDVAPPATVLASLTDRLFPETAKHGFMQRFGIYAYILAGGALAAILLTNFDLRVISPAFEPDYQASIAADDQSLIVQVAYDADTGLLQLDRTSGTAREGRSLELWLMTGNATPVSLGVLPPDSATSEITIPEPLLLSMAGGTLAITDEPLGGSSEGEPTGDLLAAAPLAQQ